MWTLKKKYLGVIEEKKETDKVSLFKLKKDKNKKITEETVCIVGTHIDELTDNETAIRTKEEIIEYLKEYLKEDFGYSLVIATW